PPVCCRSAWICGFCKRRRGPGLDPAGALVGAAALARSVPALDLGSFRNCRAAVVCPVLPEEREAFSGQFFLASPGGAVRQQFAPARAAVLVLFACPIGRNIPLDAPVRAHFSP